MDVDAHLLSQWSDQPYAVCFVSLLLAAVCSLSRAGGGFGALSGFVACRRSAVMRVGSLRTVMSYSYILISLWGNKRERESGEGGAYY